MFKNILNDKKCYVKSEINLQILQIFILIFLNITYKIRIKQLFNFQNKLHGDELTIKTCHHKQIIKTPL